MNKQIKVKSVAEMLNSSVTKKHSYVSPLWEVIEVENVQFICTSVNANVPGSSEQDWNEEGEVDDELDL